MDLLSFISGLEPLIKDHSALFAFVTSLFFGEEIILILSFLSANGYMPIWVVFVFCFAGRLTSDFFFFFMGKLNFERFLSKYQRNTIYESVDKIFSKLNRKSTFITLLYTKFLFGIRAAMMFYIGHKGISIKKTLISDIAAVFIWLLVLIPIGWFAGNSFRLILNTFDNFKIAMLFLFILVFMGVLIHHHIHKKIMNKRTQLLA